MQDVIDLVVRLRATSKKAGDRLQMMFEVPEHEPPIGAFPMCFNQATLCLESLDHYVRMWRAPQVVAGGDIDLAGDENAARIAKLMNTTFMWAMSAIEFNVRRSNQQHPNVLCEQKGRPYLSSLIRQSHGKGLTTGADFDRWIALIEFRNAIVHNNAIADRDLEQGFPGGHNIEMRTGAMVRGNLKLVISLTIWMVEAYERWCEAFLREAGLPNRVGSG